MHKTFTRLTSFALFLLLTIGVVFAQKMTVKDKFGMKRHKAVQSAQKVSDHEDTPGIELNFNWDITDWDSTGQKIYTYAANGDVVETQYEYYLAGQFVPSRKSSYTYDANGNQTEKIGQSWTNSMWENDSRQTSTFDGNGNELVYNDYSWTMGAWELDDSYRNTYQYNSSNQITEFIEEDWNPGTSMYELSYKVDVQYAQGVWSELLYSSWDGSVWVPAQRLNDIVWYDFSKELFSSRKTQVYNNSVWEDSERVTCTYSQNDSQDCIFEEFNGTWSNSNRNIIDYDAHGHNILIEGYSWAGSWSRDWGYQYDYTYDSQNRTMEIITQKLNASMVYENERRSLFSSFFMVGAESALQSISELTTFPNPVTNQLNIDLKYEKNGPVSIILFDVQGRKRLQVQSHYAGNVIAIPVSEKLENGVYSYLVNIDGKSARGKVIVQH